MRWTNYFGLRFTSFPLRLDILDSFSGWFNNINNNNSSNGSPAGLATCMRDCYIVKRGDCDSRLISFGWGVAVRFIWVRESSPQEEKLESTWARDLLFTGGSERTHFAKTSHKCLYLSQSKRWSTPCGFPRVKSSLCWNLDLFLVKISDQYITCLNWTRQKANFIGCFCLLYCMKTRSLLRQTPNCPLIPIHGPHWYYTETILICGLQSTWKPFSCWTHYFFHKIKDIQY